MRLRSGVRVLDRTPSVVQIGADPRWATTLIGLNPAEHALLLRLAQPDRPSISQARSAPSCTAIDPARIPTIAAPLIAAGLLTATSTVSDTLPSQLLDDARTADLALLAASRPTPQLSGAQAVVARSTAVVGLCGLGRVGMVALDTLAHAGVGTVLLDDSREVRPADIGIGGFRTVDVGQRRRHAAQSILARTHPGLRVGSQRDSPDLVVLVLEEVADSLRTVRLLAEGVTHLVVTVREGDIVVGPCVVPGVTACLNCQDLSRTELDADWPSLWEQLKAQGEREPSAQDSAVAGIAGALAAAQVLAYLDGLMPATAGADIEVSTSAAVPRLRKWSVHPRCGCTEMGCG